MGISIGHYSSCQSATSKDGHSLFADSQFVDPSTSDLHAASGSPVVNAGSNLGVTVEATPDYAGNARMQGSNIDIGAYEQYCRFSS